MLLYRSCLVGSESMFLYRSVVVVLLILLFLTAYLCWKNAEKKLREEITSEPSGPPEGKGQSEESKTKSDADINFSYEQELLATIFFGLEKLPNRCKDIVKEILEIMVEKLQGGEKFPQVFERVLKALDEIIRDYSDLNNEKIINEVSAAKIEKQLENTLIEIKEYLQKKLEANRYDVDKYLAGLRGIKNFFNVLKK